ncbi:MAG: hypothetical protein M1453_11565 [Acidobacteria bacterium]|nr:hypothetical protein [Acidobacteriota bacterium]MCL5288615.1 hypothetical protein [Acidobacteriota bacterium]
MESALEFNLLMIYVESVETALAFYSALGFREVDQFAGGGRLVSERRRSS